MRQIPAEAGAARPTRWQLTAEGDGSTYAERFAGLVDEGTDIDGEARLADALLPRRGTVLDVGSGMGRVGAALLARGHHVTAVEPDPALVTQSRRTYRDLAVVGCDILDFDPAAYDAPAAYDLVVCVGNVLLYLAEGTERIVLARLRSLLSPGGRMLAGFHLVSPPGGARTYPPSEFTVDVTASGLRVDARFGSYELHPPHDEYAVWVLSAV